MPRNRSNKKDLDVQIGSANLPVSQTVVLNSESAAAVVEEEKHGDRAPFARRCEASALLP